jgi:hypothetical protein
MPRLVKTQICFSTILNIQTVLFEDGSTVDADHVMYATGYKITFPFFGSDVLDSEKISQHNKLQLYKRVFLPQFDNLAFIGFNHLVRYSRLLRSSLDGLFVSSSNWLICLPFKKCSEILQKQEQSRTNSFYCLSPSYDSGSLLYFF